MKITLVAAISNDGFIADINGNGNFSSPQDKLQFREYLRSDSVSGFICGNKTANEFKERLTYKPLYVLTHQSLKDTGNIIYFKNWIELIQKYPIQRKSTIDNLALLGGGETYHYFLNQRLVDMAQITIEKDISFKVGIPLGFTQYAHEFNLVNKQDLSPTTQLLIYNRWKTR